MAVSVKLECGEEFIAFAYRQKKEEGCEDQPARLILGFQSGVLDCKTGFVSPEKAREIAGFLLLQADWADGK